MRNFSVIEHRQRTATFGATKKGKNDPHCRKSFRYLACGQNSLADGDAQFWCTQGSMSNQPKKLTVFLKILMGWL